MDAYSIGMDRIDRVAAKLAHAAGRGAPGEIDPEFSSRGSFMVEARRAEAQGLHTYDRLISQQVTRQAPEPVPVPQTAVRQTPS